MRNGSAAGSSKAFLDTNILIYALDKDEPEKQQRSRSLLVDLGCTRSGVISTQILQEVFSVAMRKLKLSPLGARAVVRDLSAYDLVQVNPAIIESAMDCVILQRISIWDALIVAAAAAAGCRTLYTEGLQADSTILGVRVENPLA